MVLVHLENNSIAGEIIMDRKEYLQMCQKVSMLKESGGIKQNVPPELIVKYKEVVYYPQAYELSFDTGTTIHKAILHDLKTHSITYAELSKVVKNN